MNATYAQLCRYHYDPLDRLATCSPAEQLGIQRFYQKNRLTTEIQGQIQRAFFQTEDQLLAQHQGPNNCTLLASDQQRSVLEGLDASQRQSASYTPYGVRHPQANPLELLGYTGERADPVTGHYLLGNGYRAYNPVLMRFNSPDSLTPFGEGEMNAYAYCSGDPINRVDPTGHIGVRALVNIIKSGLKLSEKTATKTIHPIARTQAASIKGNINQIIAEKVKNLRETLEAQGVKLQRVEKARSKTRSNYLSAMRKANTLSPEEQIIQNTQIRPLPKTPDGRNIFSTTPLHLSTENSNIYEVPKAHLPRNRPGGISGILPKKTPMKTIAEEVGSIRST
jgi:RHS repeat-associated protein